MNAGGAAALSPAKTSSSSFLVIADLHLARLNLFAPRDGQARNRMRSRYNMNGGVLYAGGFQNPPAGRRIHTMEGLQQPRGWGLLPGDRRGLSHLLAAPRVLGLPVRPLQPLIAFNIPVRAPVN
jgi:hypothetical protein